MMTIIDEIIEKIMSGIKYDIHYHYVGNTHEPIIPGILIGLL